MRSKLARGAVTTDFYGRSIPKPAHGSAKLGEWTSSTRRIVDAVVALYERIVARELLVRRVNLAACRLAAENSVRSAPAPVQLDLFTDYDALAARQKAEAEALADERKLQLAMLEIKKKYGKNAILKGMNLEEGATTQSRNRQIGGHKA